MSFDCLHFSLSLPKGMGQDNIPNLLRHLANTLEEEGVREIMDIVFHNDELDENGIPHPHCTVYFMQSGA